MLHKNVIENNGFRVLNVSEIEAVNGGADIIVTGTPSDPWTISISPADLALLGIFNLGGPALPSTTDTFGGDDGGGGGGLPGDPSDPGQLSAEERDEALGTNEDSERQEAIERTLEAILEAVDSSNADWTFEYNESSGSYIGLSSSGQLQAVDSDAANDIFDSRVA